MGNPGDGELAARGVDGSTSERHTRLTPALHAAGRLLMVLGALMLVPAIAAAIYGETLAVRAFLATGVLTMLTGSVVSGRYPAGALSWRAALVLCVGAWTVYSLVGAIPISLVLGIGYLDGAFEATSGFTTTGFTVLSGLEGLPRSILLWRVLMQWFGGLGILSFFLLVSFPGGEAYRLLLMEGPKTLIQRPAPGVRGTLVILWRIYGGLTILNILALLALRVGAFNAVAYGMSTISTGGFGMHDANLGHFQAVGHPNALAVEIATMVFMLLSGIGFLSHHLLLSGRPRQWLAGQETRTYWMLLAVTTIIIVVDGMLKHPLMTPSVVLRNGAFQSASLLSGAGLATVPFTDWLAFPTGFQALMALMFIGGCVGSTAGGLKILRVKVLRLYSWHQIKRATYPARFVMPFTVGGRILPDAEVARMAVVAFCWAGAVFLGALVMALLSEHSSMVSVAVCLSAVSNMGPVPLDTRQMAAFHPLVKGLQMVLMIAGRLEILPVLSLFCRRVWQ